MTTIRDDYFHCCWLSMKASHPKMMKKMTEIELQVASLQSITKNKKKSNKKGAIDESITPKIL